MNLGLDPSPAVPAGAMEVKTSLPPGGELQLLELARSTDQELAGVAPGQPGAPAAPALPLDRELAGMFAMMGAGAGHFLPSVARVLDEGACKSLGEALAPVAQKYGLDRYLVGFAWRIELQAVMVVAPISMAIAAAVRHDLAALRAAQLTAGQGAGQASSSPFGADQAAAPAQPVGMLQPIDTAAAPAS